MVGIMNVAFGYIHSCPKMPRSLFLVHILFILALVGVSSLFRSHIGLQVGQGSSNVVEIINAPLPQHLQSNGGENMSVIKSYLLSDILCYEQTTHALFCSFTVFILFVYSNGVSVELWIISVINQK